MTYLSPTFKAVSLIFSVAAIVTGLRPILDPVSFSHSFGIPLAPTTVSSYKKDSAALTQRDDHNSALYYVSLMGVRQLGTGMILLTFAYQAKWTEMATILAIIGILVAGTDGVYLARARSIRAGAFHAIPGALISALALAFIYSA